MIVYIPRHNDGTNYPKPLPWRWALIVDCALGAAIWALLIWLGVAAWSVF